MADTIFSSDNLPNGMIGLNTTTGQEILKRTPFVNNLMVDRFTKQVNRTYCGPASLTVLINALNAAYRIKYMEIQGNEEAEEDFFKQAETRHFCVTEDDIVNLEDVKVYLLSTDINRHGLNLQQLENIAGILGFGVNKYFACGNGVCGSDEMIQKVEGIVTEKEYIFKNSDEFKKFTVDYIQRPVTGVIVNYDMSLLGYEKLCGHFSPLAAYDEATDRFLVMDVWPDTPQAWVKTEILFNAMSSIDNDSNLPRGLLHIHELLI